MRLLISTLFISLWASFGIAQPTTQTGQYPNPIMRGYALNFCKHENAECGKPAADLFCQELGFDQAGEFTPDPRAGARGVVSLIFGDGKLCEGTQCAAFAEISCVNNAVAPPPVVVETPIPTDTAAPERADVPVQRPPVTDVAEEPPLFLLGRDQFPYLLYSGATLTACLDTACQFTSDASIYLGPNAVTQSNQFIWDASDIPEATAVILQISARPFPAFRANETTLDFPGLVSADIQPLPTGKILLDFDEVYADYTAIGRGSVPDSFYIRAIPLRSVEDMRLYATPSNVMKVFYANDGVSPPDFDLDKEFLGGLDPLPLFDVRITEYEIPYLERHSRWGCVVVTGHEDNIIPEVAAQFPIGSELCPEPYRGVGDGKVETFGEFLDWSLESFDWLGDQYGNLMDLAAKFLVEYTVFGQSCKLIAGELGDDAVCGAIAKIAVQTGATALGLPPTIPSYNELVDKGIDYATELAVEQISSQTGIPCIGPCEDLIRETISYFGDELKRESVAPGCVDPTEAHAHGREPLCPWPQLIVKPAKRAITTLPFMAVEVTRTGVQIPADYNHPTCSLFFGTTFRNHFEARSWMGPNINFQTEMPEMDYEARLYAGDSSALDDMRSAPAGTTKTFYYTPTPVRFEFPWMHRMWLTSQQIRPDELGPYGDDWQNMFFDSRMTFWASTQCADYPAEREVRIGAWDE